MKKTIMLLIAISFISCSSEEKEHSIKNNLKNDRTKISGSEEYKLSIEKYGDQIHDTAVFPVRSFDRAVLYEISVSGEPRRTPFEYRTGKIKELSKEDLSEFLKIINTKESYGNTSAACFDPDLGIVLYDSEGIAMQYCIFSLNCNRIYGNPVIRAQYENENAKNGINGFSSDARKKLKEIYALWDFPYKKYSEFWDDESDLQNYLKNKKGH